MSIAELLLIAIGLSMDAFAVSVTYGLSVQESKLKYALIAGIYFGGFQAAMPLAGYYAGSRFSDMIVSIDHWVVFALLAFIGTKMLLGSFKKRSEEPETASHGPGAMLPLAIATSIDALAVGISFAFLRVDIVPAVSIIGIITFALSLLGFRIGSLFGAKYRSKAEFAGGLVLILIGLKILLEHTGIG